MLPHPLTPLSPAHPPTRRDVITPAVAPRALQEEPNPKFDNFVAGSVSMGARATISSASMVGADSVLEDRASVKRSVVGAGCVVGAGSKASLLAGFSRRRDQFVLTVAGVGVP
jgi:NDP-sugar pyrophosphorylase family protein